MPGASVKTRNGVPGADSAPRMMATTRSSVPNAVQAVSSQCGNFPLQPAASASGIAARPVMMSPQPAEIAKGDARWPWWCRIKKQTPTIRKALMPMSAQSGTDRSALRRPARINWPHPEVFDYVEYLADFRAEFHNIRNRPEFRECLSPVTYTGSQRLAQLLLQQGSTGIVYPSVREEAHGSCVACFRPALVMNVRKGISLSITFETASASPVFVTRS